MSIIIYGPACCGKTTNAKRLAEKYGKETIVDDWKPNDPIPDNALILTEYPIIGSISFEDAMKDL